MINFIRFLMVGFILGLIAVWLFPQTQSLGVLYTSCFGMAGAVVGGVLARIFSGSEDSGFNPARMILSMGGAALFILGAYHYHPLLASA